MNDHVSIIVVTYNGMQYIGNCLESIRAAKGNFRTIVVDNNSTDGTLDFVRLNFPEVVVIPAPGNLGFGRANNIGIERAIEDGSSFVFLLNQDAYLHEGNFDAMLDVFRKHEKVGVVSPIHLGPDGKDLDFGFYQYCNPRFTSGLLADGMTKSLKEHYRSDFVNAAAWLIPAKILKQVGTFHPAFDHYGEDRELIYRLRKAGYQLFIATGFSIIHDRPQNRAGNAYHNRVSAFKRKILLQVIQCEISPRSADMMFLKQVLRSIGALQWAQALKMIKGWSWVRERSKIKRK